MISFLSARTYDERDERILEKINFAIDGGRFERLVSLNLCDVGNASAVPDEGALSYRSIFNLIPVRSFVRWLILSFFLDT